MSEIFPKDILIRVGGRTLQRYGVLAVAGSRRGPVDVPITFTRASVRRFRDRDVGANVTLGRKAASGVLAVEHPANLTGLVDQFGYPYCGPALYGARTQLNANPENFGAWASGGTPILTSGQADPFGGTAAYVIEDDAAGATEWKEQSVSFTADGAKSIAGFIRQDNAAVTDIELFDNTAGVSRHNVRATWAGGVPTLSTVSGGGDRFAVEDWGPIPGTTTKWWRISFNASSVVAANVNVIRVFPAGISAANTGRTFFFGFNAWNEAFPGPYQGPGETPSAGEVASVPVNFGPGDLTVLVRLARPAHADQTGDIGIFPNVFVLGNRAAGGSHESSFGKAGRDISSEWWWTGANSVSKTNGSLPAGNELILATQLKNPTTAPQVTLDVTGAGMLSFSSVGTGLQAFGAQTLSFANGSLYSVLLDLIIARGLHTRAEMLAIP